MEDNEVPPEKSFENLKQATIMKWEMKLFLNLFRRKDKKTLPLHRRLLNLRCSKIKIPHQV